jgi:flagellar export protein FliJ
MKSFRFSLDTALHWRETQLQLEDEKLSRLFAELERLQSRKAENEQARRAASKSQLQRGELPGSDYRAFGAYLVGLDFKADLLRAEVTTCSQRIEQQQSACIAARRAVKLLELLKEKQRKLWQREADLALETAATESHLARRVRSTS